MTTSPREKRFALLIDADNISDQYVRIILNELASQGTVLCKRIYGDWTSPQHSKWKNVLLRHAIQPIQQYGYTTGKNATDSAMIIDAMDLLYSGNYDGFCLASSDSDFTRLAVRLREGGMHVIGMGEQKTPKAFCVSCNEFKFLDLLKRQAQPSEGTPPPKAPPKVPTPAETPKAPTPAPKPQPSAGKAGIPAETPPKGPAAKPAPPPAAQNVATAPAPQPPAPKREPQAKGEPLPSPTPGLKAIRGVIHAILNENSDEDGWLALTRLKELLVKRQPSFDSRNFGKAKFSAFLRLLDTLELRQTSAGHIDAARRKANVPAP